MNNSWLAEVWRLFGLIAAAIIVGLLLEQVFLVLSITLFGYLAWTFINLRHLYRWLAKGKKYSPPTSVGLWGQIFTEIYRLQKRNKKRQRRLVNLLARFRETTEAMPDGVVVMQANGTIEWWNDVGGKMLSLTYPQDVGQRLTNLVRNPEFQAFYQRENPDELFHFAAPGDVNKTVAVRIIEYGKEQSLLIARDVTLLERVEQIRRDFVANISHELRTPLTVMTGFLEAMSHDTDDDEHTARSIQLMQQQAKRMYRLVEDLMLLSKLENEQKPIKHEIVAVPQMLSTLKEEAQILSGDRKHEIILDIEDDLYLYGDSKELDSAFMNLVVNAVNYTPEQGKITIHWYQDKDLGAVFKVVDSGIGIPAHHIKRLTERFYRVDVARSRETGGSGLGLAIVKHALNRHGAELRIKSEVGRGSEFICIFKKDAIINKNEMRHAI